MPIKSSFNLAGDARREIGGAPGNLLTPPRPISSSKVHPFSRFHAPASTMLSGSSASSVSPRICSAVTPTHFHSVDIDSHQSSHSVSFTNAITAPCIFPNSTASSNHVTTDNSHHLRFASNLSRPLSSLPLSASSSRAPRMIFSKFRPPVPAPDRLCSWTSPFALQKREHLKSNLPGPLVDAAFRVVSDSLAPSTKSTYAAGILRFHQFCDSWAISEEARMPASPTLLAAFVGQCSGSYAGNTIRSWLAGIRAWHIAHQASWFGDHDWVKKGRITAFKEGTAFKAPLRAPVSLDHLHALHRRINLHDPLHAAIWAVATITFFGCRRLGETTVKSPSAFNPLHHVTRTASITFRSLPNGSSSASIRIPWTKTTKHEGATVIITSRPDFSCPVTALHNHLQINRDAPPSTSLFGYRTPCGTWSHMFRDTFLTFVIKVWHSLSLDHVSGHSFRIGGAVTLLLAGVPPEVVAATGGWTSLAFLLYWRRMEQIIPMCTSKAYNSSHISTLSHIFEQFRIDQNIPVSALVDGHM